MHPAYAPPGLAAVLVGSEPRNTRLRVLLTKHEHKQLATFAEAAGRPTATLAHALIAAGLQRLVAEQAEGILHQQQEAA